MILRTRGAGIFLRRAQILGIILRSGFSNNGEFNVYLTVMTQTPSITFSCTDAGGLAKFCTPWLYEPHTN